MDGRFRFMFSVVVWCGTDLLGNFLWSDATTYVPSQHVEFPTGLDI